MVTNKILSLLRQVAETSGIEVPRAELKRAALEILNEIDHKPQYKEVYDHGAVEDDV